MYNHRKRDFGFNSCEHLEGKIIYLQRVRRKIGN